MKHSAKDSPRKRDLIHVLSIASAGRQHRYLKQALATAAYQPDLVIEACDGLGAALELLSQRGFAVVICESELADGTWRDLLNSMPVSGGRPALVVTSRLADEYLWAEALNLGAFDVLAQPFHPEEVCRVVHAAWRSWQHRAGGQTFAMGSRTDQTGNY